MFPLLSKGCTVVFSSFSHTQKKEKKKNTYTFANLTNLSCQKQFQTTSSAIGDVFVTQEKGFMGDMLLWLGGVVQMSDLLLGQHSEHALD